MQFRLSTLLLAMVVFGTSLSLAGPCGIALAVYVVLLVGLTRACLSGRAGIGGACLVWLIGIGLPVLLMPMISVAGPAARRCQCANNLKQIALGLQDYGDKCGCLPPPYVPDKNGKPMHSWRVLVLPYIQQGGLYQAYRFDEPWDGPNNSKLAAAANYAYVCSGDRTTSVQGQTATNYVAVTGKGTAWSSSKLSLSGEADGRPQDTPCRSRELGNQLDGTEGLDGRPGDCRAYVASRGRGFPAVTTCGLPMLSWPTVSWWNCLPTCLPSCFASHSPRTSAISTSMSPRNRLKRCDGSYSTTTRISGGDWPCGSRRW